MLNYYFHSKLSENDSKRSFLRLSNTLQEIIDENKKVLRVDVVVEVHCIFAFDKAIQKIEHEFISCGLKINPLKKVNFEKYKTNEDVINLIDCLYGYRCNKNLDNRVCVLRAHNMPFDIMLPKEVLNIGLVGGILQRKNEM